VIRALWTSGGEVDAKRTRHRSLEKPQDGYSTATTGITQGTFYFGFDKSHVPLLIWSGSRN